MTKENKANTYVAAVTGRRTFRRMFRDEKARADAMRTAVEKALWHLRFATPQTRNGPCIQAIGVLERALEGLRTDG